MRKSIEDEAKYKMQSTKCKIIYNFQIAEEK